jgi:formylglycine-generating enzyme required for sulfatase activity
MKLFLVVLAIVFCFGFSISKKKKFIPPGTVQINDTLFADETEVSMLSWHEYVYWMRDAYGKGSKEYLSSLPDTNVWRFDSVNKQSAFSSFYFKNMAYKDYPVVGVSYEQVLAFCKWRTERVREFMWMSKKYDLINFEYRLPSKQEWELMSNNGTNVFNYKNDVKFHTNKKKEQIYESHYRANCIFNDTVPKANTTAPVYSYWQNRFGLFNMIGNVSEMVLEKNISKGGSWRHKMEECRVGKDISYATPTNWLGFRCVCVIKK